MPALRDVGTYTTLTHNAGDRISMPSLLTIGDYLTVASNDMVEFYLPLLQSVGNYMSVSSNANMLNFFTPLLKSVSSYVLFNGNDAALFLRLHNLTSIGDYLTIQNHALLKDLDFPALQEIGDYLTIFDNEELRDVDFNVLGSLGTTTFCGQAGDNEHVCVDDNEALDNISFPLLQHDHFQIFIQPGTPTAYSCAHFFGRDPWCARVGDGRPTSATVCETNARIQTQEVLVCNYTIPMNTSLVTAVRGKLELIGTGDTFGYVALPSLVAVGGDLYISGISSKRETFILPKLVNVSGSLTIKYMDYDEGDWTHRIRRAEFPLLRRIDGFAYIYYNQHLEKMLMPQLLRIGEHFYMYYQKNAERTQMPQLETVGTYFRMSSCHVGSVRNGAYLDIGSLRTIGSYWHMDGNTYLYELNASSLVSTGSYIRVSHYAHLPWARLGPPPPPLRFDDRR